MKARITIVFGTAVVALALAAGALAAPVKGLDYTRPSASTGWTSYDAFGHPLWPIIGFFGLRASDANRPGAVKPNPWSIRASVGPFASTGWTRASS
jgi:hypothetical protein